MKEKLFLFLQITRRKCSHLIFENEKIEAPMLTQPKISQQFPLVYSGE